MENFDDLLNNSPAGEQPQIPKEQYAAKKQDERAALFELSDNTALEVSGDGDRFRQYLDVQSKFDRYSAVNALLILAQKPEATRLGDFEHWKAKDGYVNPGQSAISILEPHSYTKEDGSPGTGYNIKKVFDISQVDTRKISTTPPPSYTNRQLLAALVSKAPVKITGVDALPDSAGSMFDHERNEINILRGMEFADTFRSVAHGLCYAELSHKDNADPQFLAYCASYMLCKQYGVDTQKFSFSSAPIQFADMGIKAVKSELSQIRDAAAAVTGRMVKQLDAVSKAAKSQDAR